MAMEDCFTTASSDSEWYEVLQRSGSCLNLYDLLHENRELIHELGPDGITVLHKGVDHGCVKLVRFVLVDMFNEAGICKCKGEANGLSCALTREGLLRKTTKYGSTAVNMAIVSGSPKMVLLLEWAIRVSSKDKKIVESVNKTSCPVDNGELLRIAGLNDRERAEEIESVVNVVDEVPDVKDDEISKSIYREEKFGEKTYDRDMQLELHKIIAAKLNVRSTGEDGAVLKFLKERCAKHVDFEFVPVEHIFLHFLISYVSEMRGEGHPEEVEGMIYKFTTRFMEDIVAECKMWDEKNETSETMQMTLFNILDPRGYTIMHTLFRKLLNADDYTPFYDFVRFSWRLVEIFQGVASERAKPWQCYSAKDGAGRTLYHMASIYDSWVDRSGYMKPNQYGDVNIEVTPLCYNEFTVLRVWSFEGSTLGGMKQFYHTPIYLAVLFNSRLIIGHLLLLHAKEGFLGNLHTLQNTSYKRSPLHMASCLGRTILVELFLKHQVQFKKIWDGGFDWYRDYHPTLQSASVSGQAEVIQMILKYPIYDPMCRDRSFGNTALQFACYCGNGNILSKFGGF